MENTNLGKDNIDQKIIKGVKVDEIDEDCAK